MRLFAAVALSVLCVQACGGSASETPFPQEPLPEYVTQTQKGAPAASASDKAPSAESGKASGAKGSGKAASVETPAGTSTPPNSGASQPASRTPAF
jgi:hypothetical protein